MPVRRTISQIMNSVAAIIATLGMTRLSQSRSD
jgi:hypothetical protein